MTIQYERKSKEERVASILRAMAGEGWVTAGRVGRLTGLSRSMAYKYLQGMARDGLLAQETTGQGLTGSTRYHLYRDTEDMVLQEYYHLYQERF